MRCLTLLCCLLGLVAAGSAEGQARGAAPAGADRLLGRDTAVRIGRLPNGLTFYVRRNPEPRNRAELRLAVNAGSTLEDPDQRGLAHFVEHMAFNGTRRFPKGALVDYLEGIGMRFGPDINAYTSYDETAYQLSVPTDSVGALETGFRVLEDWAGGISFDTVEVRRERGVVVEEWRLGRGAEARVWDRQAATLFGRSRYAERPPIGDRATLERAGAEALRRFYRDWYRPDLMAVVVVGDIDPVAVERRIREGFGMLPRPARVRPRTRWSVPDHPVPRVGVVGDPELTATQVSLYRTVPVRTDRTVADYRHGLAEGLFGGMLYDRLHELTLVPDAPLLGVGMSQGVLVRARAANVLSVEARPGQAEAGLATLLRELERVRRHGFTRGELEREKRETLRRWEGIAAEQSKMPSGQYAAEYVSHFLYGGPLLPVDAQLRLHRELLPLITLGEVNAEVRRWAGPTNQVVLASAPATDSIRPPTEAALRAALVSATRGPLTAYRDVASDRALLARTPAPGKIVAERALAEIGVWEWRLSNGARVVLKPTDFRTDEVLLAGWSPGGLSLAPDSLWIPASTATGVVQVGGVGDWDLVGLGKRLTGIQASVGVHLEDLGEGLSGVASPRDLRTLFELTHLYFTSPRSDSVAFRAYRSRARAALLERDRSPEQLWTDTLRDVLTQGHPRARPLHANDLDRMDLAQSLAFYRERLADAGDWTFYLIGNFEPDSLRPLVERYLATLPATGRSERGRDLGIRAPRGVVRKTVRRGSEPKARTQLVWTGPAEWDRSQQRALQVLAGVLEIRLREALREDLGGTYGVGVSAGMSREPVPQFRVSIGFGSSPERLEELTRVVWAEIDSVKANGPRERDLHKVREIARRERELRVRENDWWLGQLMLYDRYGWDPRELARLGEVAPVASEAIREAARRYLDPANYVQVSLVPETTTP